LLKIVTGHHTAMGWIPYEYRNLVAFLVHALSLIGLLVSAASQANFTEYDDIFWVTGSARWEPRHWYYTCISATIPCPDDKKSFYVTPPRDAVNLNIIWMATIYVAWSSLLHMVAQFVPGYQVPLRWLDYCLTAPVMLSVMALIFGCDNLCAVVLGPALLMILLITAYQIEPVEGHKTSPPMPETGLLGVLLLLYGVAWAPIMYAVARIIDERQDLDLQDEAVRSATAPDEIMVPFASVMFVLFSSFALVYVYDWAIPYSRREDAYITLSMISKTTLHLFIGLTVISQIKTVSAGGPSGQESDMETLQAGLGGAAAIVFGFTALNFWGFTDGPNNRYAPLKPAAAAKSKLPRLVNNTSANR